MSSIPFQRPSYLIPEYNHFACSILAELRHRFPIPRDLEGHLYSFLTAHDARRDAIIRHMEQALMDQTLLRPPAPITIQQNLCWWCRLKLRLRFKQAKHSKKKHERGR